LNQRRIEVATIRLRGDEPKQVEALRAFGVEPVRYSLVGVTSQPMFVALPRSASGELNVQVEPVGPDVRAYRISFENLSSARSVIALEYKAFRNDQVTMSSRRSIPSANRDGLVTFGY
jgi:hypothetical protein